MIAKQLSVNHLLERAVVKVLINDTFKGTGFFISPDYVLTAYHCLNTLVDSQDIYVENQTYGRMRVLLDQEKSLPDPKQDIAVLQLFDKTVADFLPLGVVNETQRGDEILAVGYPAGILSFISGEIHGFPEEFPQQFFNNAMKAKGQSGGMVYHPTLRRVVGIALELYHQEIVKDGGLAGRFDVLLRQWTELETLNQQAINRWDNLLQPKPLLSKPIVMTWGGVIAAVLLMMWLLLGRGEQQQTIIAPNSNVTVGNKLIDNTVVNNNTYYGISPDVFAKYAADLGVTDAALANFFKILEQNKVDRLDLDKKLREIAENYQKLLENAKLLENSDDPKVKELLRQAREFIEGLDAQGKPVTIDFAQAEALLQQAFEEKRLKIKRLREVEEKAKTAREKEELETARILAQQGELANIQFKYADAGSYYQQAAELLPERYELDKGLYFNNAGMSFQKDAKHDSALPLLQKSVNIFEKIGKQHPIYLKALSNLAGLYRDQESYDEALALSQIILEIRGQILGKNHPDYAFSLNELALIYEILGEDQKALPLYQESLKIKENTIGKQSISYAKTLGNLAVLYGKQGNYETALALHENSSKIFGQVLGKQHPDYAISLRNFALFYQEYGKLDEASSLHQEILMILEQTLGSQHFEYAMELNNLAGLYNEQGKYREALPLFKQAVKIAVIASKEEHPDAQVFVENLTTAQNRLNGEHRVIVEQVLPDSRAAQLGIQVGDIFTHYDQQPILGTAQFIQGRAKEPADGAAKELTVLRDGKSLTFQLKPCKIGVELEEELKSEP